MCIICANIRVNSFSLFVCGGSFHFFLIIFNSTQTATSPQQTQKQNLRRFQNVVFFYRIVYCGILRTFTLRNSWDSMFKKAPQGTKCINFTIRTTMALHYDFVILAQILVSKSSFRSIRQVRSIFYVRRQSQIFWQAFDFSLILYAWRLSIYLSVDLYSRV